MRIFFLQIIAKQQLDFGMKNFMPDPSAASNLYEKKKRFF